jgi:5-methylcytosine-specific restriction endonuclease McrA
MKPHLWLRIARVDAWTRQGGLCCWCRSALPRNEATAEHMVPRADGGSDQSHNIAAACGPCNKARGRLGAARFRSMLRRIVSKDRPRVRERQIIFRLNRRSEKACRRILALVSQQGAA